MTLQAVAKLYKMSSRQCTLVRCTERWPQADAQKEPPRKGGFFSSLVFSWPTFLRGALNGENGEGVSSTRDGGVAGKYRRPR